eukprot:910188_1
MNESGWVPCSLFLYRRHGSCTIARHGGIEKGDGPRISHLGLPDQIVAQLRIWYTSYKYNDVYINDTSIHPSIHPLIRLQISFVPTAASMSTDPCHSFIHSECTRILEWIERTHSREVNVQKIQA